MIVLRVVLFLLLNVAVQVSAQSEVRTYNLHFLGEFLYPTEFGLIQFRNGNGTVLELNNNLFDDTNLNVQKNKFSSW